MPKKTGKHVESAGAYATAADFRRIFTEDIDSLYLLSLLLTGDPEQAEKCFVAGIEKSAEGNYVFREWARSWARRTIIQCAIRSTPPGEFPVTEIRIGNTKRIADKIPLVLHAEVSAVLQLPPLERFVFVMSVLERYSDNDCSILLGRTRRDIATARTHAIQQLATLLRLEPNSRMDADSGVPMELTVAQRFASLAWSDRLSQ